MNWMTLLWPVMVGACLTLGLISLRLALEGDRRVPYLFFALSAFSIAVISGLELALMRTTDLTQYDTILRWAAVPIFFMTASVTGFVWSFFGTGKSWIALVGVALNGAAQMAEILSPIPAVRHAVALHQVKALGGVSFTVPTIEGSIWNFVELVSVIIVLVFILDASVVIWRKGEHRRAALVGGGVFIFFVIARGDALFVEDGYWQTPYLVSFAFVGVLIAVAIELSNEVLNAARFSRLLRETELHALRQREEMAHMGRVSMMGQLASALAHEINQPLSAILRNAEAAKLFLEKATPDLALVREIISDIRKDDQRACDVIARLRALLKRQDVESTPLAVNELLRDAVALARADAAARQVKLEINAPGDLPLIRADRVHFQQVLLNLMLNAMDAMNDLAADRKKLTLHADRDDAGFVVIAVRDTGTASRPIGLPKFSNPFFPPKRKEWAWASPSPAPLSRRMAEKSGRKIIQMAALLFVSLRRPLKTER